MHYERTYLLNRIYKLARLLQSNLKLFHLLELLEIAHLNDLIKYLLIELTLSQDF
jgi:hypothetical protein